MTITQTIEQKLTENLKPLRLELVDDSESHRGHAGHKGRNESHFKLLIVSDKFEGLSMVKQHKLIYNILADEMKIIHALALKTIKPSQIK